MAYVNARGIRFYYEEHGEGAPLIVAHGLLGSVAALPRFGERPDEIAARGVHLVAYDARGHGRSGYTTRRTDYAWSALAEDMHGFMRALGIERASIYGGSMGAGTALMLAAARPEAIDRLVLNSPPPFGEDMRRVRPMFGGLAMLYRLFGTRLAAQLVSALPQTRRTMTEDQRRDLRDFLAHQRRKAIVPAIRGLLFGPQIPLETLGHVHHPALILTHPDDAMHPLRSGEILHDRMPHARLAVAPTASYWAEHKDGLTDTIAAFVRGEPLPDGLSASSRQATHVTSGGAR